MTARADQASTGVTIRLVGGLGNQLFGYACGRAVATRLDCPLFVDVSYFAHQPSGDTPRSFELDWLVASDQLVHSASGASANRLARAVRRRMAGMLPSSEFHERSFGYDPTITDVRPGDTLNGYFQSWRYFESIATDLRETLLAASPTSAWSRAETTRLDAGGPWIAVHVRRGDYASAKNIGYHGLLGPDYYEGALTALNESIPNARLVLFSDDPEQATALVEPLHHVDHVVIPPAEAHPMESLTLMSRASAVITANSSFSWWGAWLADPARTPATAPTPWFAGSGHPEEDLCPPQWVRLPHSRTT